MIMMMRLSFKAYTKIAAGKTQSFQTNMRQASSAHVMVSNGVGLFFQDRFRAGIIIMVTAAVGTIIGSTSLQGIISDPLNGGLVNEFWSAFQQIIYVNLPSALLLYVGVITFGAGTIFAVFMLSTFIGATMTAAATNAGWSAVVSSIWLYAPLEFLGFSLAGTAGVLPIVSALSRAYPISWYRAYCDGMIQSIRILVLAVCIIFMAAFLEAAVISFRHGV